MFENLSMGHLLIVAVIVLLLFGAKRIPEIAGSMGKGINEFKKTMNPDANNNNASAPAAPQQIASREPAGLSSPRPSDSTSVAQSDDVVREPKRLF